MFHLIEIKPPRPSLKSILLGGLGSGIGIISIMLSMALFIVELLTHPQKRTFMDFYTFTPYEMGLPGEDVTFAPLHGDHRVRAWYIPSPGANTTIITCPGYRSRISDVLGISGSLWKAGHNVLAFEYYGHGLEVGSTLTLGYRELNDFLGAVKYARERGPQAHIGVMAYSMGASIAIMGSAQTEEVEALILDAPFASHQTVFNYQFQRMFHLPPALFTWITDYVLWLKAGYHFRQVDPLRDIARIAPRPVFLIQGTKDSIVDPRDSMRLFEAAGEPKELWIVPNADHCGSYFEGRAAYTQRMLDFFDLHLRKQPHMLRSQQEQQEQVEEVMQWPEAS